ncbi:Monohem cytochrome C protein [Croceitalea dokdonensis DOKDO 023]|uniref:Monohem cytochrome C protein n=1 Tax=Croceitalea dokdonensis DOKDO 023 TaxID=1300341 RepID=A0A0P7B3K1_9FLAO|nr:hypothetical protein [Croceitalea dokdonensis]KPM33091.1 Monohem cytochrome C protein [Croceitalea dokdonensis DOKDO 023]
MTNLSRLGLLLLAMTSMLIMTTSCEEDAERFLSEAKDTDGDGVLDSADEAPNDPCLPLQQMAYTGFNVFNASWAGADCDGDGVTNGAEFEDKRRNPYLDENMQDADGDGVADFMDPEPNDPCVPLQEPGYLAFNSENELWGAADCDGDLVSNIDEFINGTDPYLACNLNFDQSNFLGELRTIDSINGEGITLGEIGTDCGVYVFNGGGIFNQGCFNDDVAIPFLFTPNDTDSSEGTITVDLTTYECLSEDGTETTQFTVSGNGTYQGELGRLELNYIMTTPDGEIEGTLNIRSLDDEGDEEEECTLDSFEGEYNTIITIDGNEDFGNALLTQQEDGCNDFVLSGDFLNLGCGNDFEINVFLGAEEDGSEIIIEDASFTCTLESGENIEYTFNAFGEYSPAEGFLQLNEFTLSDSNGNTSNGEIFFEFSNGNGEDGGEDEEGDDCAQNSFEGTYNTIVNTNGTERFGNASFTAGEGCGDFLLSGDFLNLGCGNTVEIEVFLGAEEDGAEIIIENASFTCTVDGTDTEYTFTAFGSYSPAEGFIELSEYTLTDAGGNQTTGSVFFESL